MTSFRALPNAREGNVMVRREQSRNAKARRHGIVILGGAIGAFAAAAAMATGSTVTAAPAKADIDALLDPIIQPLITSLADSLAGFDPTAAADLTSWADSLLNSLNSIDFALPAAADPGAATAAVTPDITASGPYDIPLTMHEVTEPTVQVSVDGGSSLPMLVDTGSSGLVVPWQDLGSNAFVALEHLFQLGAPASSGISGYSGGVEYLYLTYNNVPTDYGDGVLSTNGPVDVEVLSWPTSFSPPYSFDSFLADNQVNGILGIGADTAGPTTSPLASYGGVLVDIPQKELIVDATNPATAFDTISGAPVTNGPLTETVTNGSQTVSSSSVFDDLDSGGVYGTFGSNVPAGDTITVSDGSTVLYSYTVGTDSLGNSTAPFVVSGVGTAGNPVDSGVEPYLQHPIYIDYATDTLYFDNLVT
jgi:PE-PGRS C-terminal aspartyl peptidase-like domain